MASTYSELGHVELPAPGEKRDLWGAIINQSLVLIEDMIAGVTEISNNGGTVLLSEAMGASDTSRNAIILCNGTLTSDLIVQVPFVSHIYHVRNQTVGGGFVVKIKTQTGSPLSIPSGYSAIVHVDDPDESDDVFFLSPPTSVTTGAPIVTGATLSDGDYGDITVSGSGTSLTIDAGSVTNAKLASMATLTLKGNNTGGTAAPSDLTVSDVKTMLAYTAADVGAQPADADLTTWAGLTPSANAQSLVIAANYAAMRALLDLEAGTDFYSIAAADAAFQVKDATLTSLAAYNTNGFLVQTALDTFVGRTLTGTANQIAIANGDGSGVPTFSLPAAIVTPGTLRVPNGNFSVGDSDNSHGLIITTSSNLTADRTLTIVTGDGNRQITINGTSVISQDYQTSASPQFAGINVGHATDSTITRVSAGVLAIEGVNILTATDIGTTVQAIDADLTSWAGVTRAVGFDTFAATPSSANLRSLLTDESGSSALYFQGGDIGTPSAGVLTNATGLPTAGLVNDAVTYAKMQNASAGNVVLARAAATSGDYGEVAIAASQLFGRGSTGDLAAITLGTNLSMSGTTLNATGGGGGLSDADYGDITVSGSGTALTIDADVVTNAKLANMATATFKGRTTAGTGDPEDLTVAQATALLNVMTGGGSTGLKGLVPAQVAGDVTKFLRGDATWAAIPGGGDMLAANNLSDVASATTARTNLGVGTGDSPQFTAINVGHATDTTVTRSAAGIIAVEGVDVVTLSASQALSNKTITHAAGSTSVAPLTLTSGTNLTTAAAGNVEYDGKVGYFTPQSTQRGVVQASQLFRLNSAFAGSNATGNQKIFNKEVTVSSSTVYAFRMLFVLSKTAGTTSHNISVSLLGSGTATVNNILTQFHQNSAAGGSGTVTALARIVGTTSANITVTGALTTATSMHSFAIEGTVSINAGGTLIPTYALSAAPGGAYSTLAGSYMEIWPIGASGADVNVGTWA